MMLDLREQVKRMTVADIEFAQNVDLDLYVREIQCRVQKLYDNAGTPKQKAIADSAFVMVLSVIDQAEKLIGMKKPI
jgi:hypothetical protein